MNEFSRWGRPGRIAFPYLRSRYGSYRLSRVFVPTTPFRFGPHHVRSSCGWSHGQTPPSRDVRRGLHLMRSSLYIAAAVAVSLAAISCATPPPLGWEAFLSSGTWGWSRIGPSCEENPHTISLSEDGKVLLLRMRDPVVTSSGEEPQTTEYIVLVHTPDYLRMRIPGETRHTSRGDLVVWDLIREDEDAYCWRRTDWHRKDCMATIERCEES